MIVISDRLYVNSAEIAATEANRPRIGLHNVFAEGTIAASTTDDKSFAENIADYNTFDYWKPTTLPASITVTLSAAQTVDYMGIAAHNLFDGSCTITAQYWDGAAWQDCHTAVTPANNKDFMVLFDEVSSTQFRLYITGTTVPLISVGHIGEALKFPKNFYQGHTPVNLARKSTVLKNVSDGGYDLGVSHLRTGAATTVNITNIETGWIRNELTQFNDDALTKAFFFAWRPDDFSADVAYCWLNRDAKATNTNYPDLMNLTFNCEAHVELGEKVIPYNIECIEGVIDRYVTGSENPSGWCYVLPNDNLIVTDGAGNGIAFCYTDYTGQDGNIQLSHRSGAGPGHSGSCGLLAPDGVTLFTAGRSSAWWNVSWFAIWDITDPNSPVLRGTFGSPDGWFYRCGEMAYDSVNEMLYVVSSQSDGVSIIDVSDLDNPVKVQRMLANDYSPALFDFPTGIAYYDGHIYIAGYSSHSFTVASVNTSPRAFKQTLVNGTDGVVLNNPWFVWIYEAAELAYVGSVGRATSPEEGWLTVFDISDPDNVTQVTATNLDGNLGRAAKFHFNELDETLYVCDPAIGQQKIHAVSLVDPRDPVYLSSVDSYIDTNNSINDSVWACDLDTTTNILYATGYYRWDSYQMLECGCVADE